MTATAPDAIASIVVEQDAKRVWTALTDPAEICHYFFGTQVITDWTVGGPIVFQGEWQGKTYRDHGRILAFDPPRLVTMTHYSPLTGLPDLPENYHTVSYLLEPAPTGTTVTIRQGGNRSAGEVTESERTWNLVLTNLKSYLEQA